MSNRMMLTLLVSAGALAGFAARADETIVTPKQFKWTAAPALAKGAQIAVVQGDPKQPGPYTYAVKFPANFKVAPHDHSDTRTYVIVSGTLYQGQGEKFDKAGLKALPPGSVMIYTGGKHFAASKEPVTFIVSGTGPSELTYVNPADDPRKK